MAIAKELTVAEMSRRSGLPVSTLHYYEAEGLIMAHRTAARHRRYPRHMLRRVAVIRIAQELGLTLTDIKAALSEVPLERAPTAEEWKVMSAHWQGELNQRINKLKVLRDQLHHCIGCGCMSVKSCPIYNADDRLGTAPGPQRFGLSD
ncbi:redox-sensitive transcriptional activator SoxR [Paracoccaceae bacterium GXU_MW_L88]